MRIVKIKWEDSTYIDIGWGKIEEFKPCYINSSGIVLKEDDGRIVISHSVGDNNTHYNAFMIPKGCIIEMEELYNDEKAGDKAQVPSGKNRKRRNKVPEQKGS
jgi:hypothetical protein